MSTLQVRGSETAVERSKSASPKPSDSVWYGNGDESYDSPVKVKISDPKVVRRQVADDHRRDVERVANMKSFLKEELQRQMDEKARAIAKEKQRDKEEFLEYARAIDAKQAAEDAAAKIKDKESKAAYRKGLSEQVDELQLKAKEARLREAQSAVQVNAHCSFGFMEEVEAKKLRKRREHEHMVETLQDAAATRSRRSLEQKKDYDTACKAAQHNMDLGVHEVAAQRARLKAAQATLEKRYEHFTTTAIEPQIQKQQLEEARVEEEARVQAERWDNMYARREAARERQRQVNLQELEAQVRAKASSKQVSRFQKEAELEVMNSVAIDRGDRDLLMQQSKRQQEIEHQKDLCKQMAERFAREGRDHTTRRQNATISTMVPPPQPLCVAQDLPRYLDKPMGTGDPVQGLPPLDASMGTLRKLAGLSWEPVLDGQTVASPQLQTKRSPAKAPEKLPLQRKVEKSSWAERVSTAELKAGRKAAASREKGLAIQKDPIADIVTQVRRRS